MRERRKLNREQFYLYDKRKVERLKEKDYFRYFYNRKKRECKYKNIEFNITKEYLKEIWTGICPISKEPIELNVTINSSTKAHLDRVDPNKGYTIDNVCWISGKFNLLKSNGTLDDFRKLTKYLEEMNG